MRVLVHYDVRIHNVLYLETLRNSTLGPAFSSQESEDSFLICCGGGSKLPSDLTGIPAAALGHFWLGADCDHGSVFPHGVVRIQYQSDDGKRSAPIRLSAPFSEELEAVMQAERQARKRVHGEVPSHL